MGCADAPAVGAPLSSEVACDRVSCQIASSSLTEGEEGILIKEMSEPASDMLSSVEVMSVGTDVVRTVMEATCSLCGAERVVGMMTEDEAIDSEEE